MPTHRIELPQVERTFNCSEEQNLLKAMNYSGISGIPSGCAEGGCGVCKVQVAEGNYETGKMSAKKIGEAERALGILLACRVYPRSDLKVLIVDKFEQDQPIKGVQ